MKNSFRGTLFPEGVPFPFGKLVSYEIVPEGFRFFVFVFYFVLYLTVIIISYFYHFVNRFFQFFLIFFILFLFVVRSWFVVKVVSYFLTTQPF
jgi:hypothetical protein